MARIFLILIINRSWSSIDKELVVKEARKVREHQRLRLIIFNLFTIYLFFKLFKFLLLLYVILHV
jgi:hypothetical protein